MALLKSVGDFFALDIGTNAVRVVQLSPSGQNQWTLQHYGYAAVDLKTTTANSKESERRLGEIIMTAVGQSGIKTKNVAIGLPSQKTFTTVIDVPNMPEAELRSTIKYQIDQYIPMAIDEAKVDWVPLGQSAHDPQQQEVLLASTANSYAEERLEFVENLGLNVIAAEPDPIAMIRALLPTGVTDARLIIDVGELSTDLVVTYNDAPRLVRTIPTGIHSLVKAAVQNLNVQEDQARQFIIKFGLAPDRLEGQVYHAVEGVLENFTAELTKSIKFFQTRYPNTPVGGILLSGYASVVPKFGEYVTAKTGIQSMQADPWQKVKMSQSDQQQLGAISTEFATAVGLAQRSNKK
ncbi:MAG TPA: type IV pilus assembly protein PilM [Candidatus Saccharimonadales bacterium]|jgi:type IV pilus assembly protein PilM|nr:type IV pilus assembly protein PilM [Candidatus Saccharimonadales bacterium]